MISIVVPVFNESENVGELYAHIKVEVSKISEPFEIIFVDDGSNDGTYSKLCSLAPLKIIRLQKNFGQTAAMDAGFHAAKGEVVVTLDGDLQNDPSDIAMLVKKLREGYDVVSGWRADRHDPFSRRVLSRMANWLTFKVTGLYLHDHACALKAYRTELFKDVHLYGEMHVFLPAYLHGRGARVTEVKVKHHERTHGASKHNFIKAVKDISDLLTVKFLSQYMSRPLVLFGGWGLFFGLAGFGAAAASIVLKVMSLRNFGQTPLPILAVFLVIIGFMLFMMGFLAELMIRIYCESQNIRPYIVRDTVDKN